MRKLWNQEKFCFVSDQRFALFLNFIFLYFYMGVHACAYRGQNPLQLELTPIVRHLMWVLGMEPTPP